MSQKSTYERESLRAVLIDGEGSGRDREVGKYHNSDLLNIPQCKLVRLYTGEESDKGITDDLAARGNLIEEGIAGRLKKKYRGMVHHNPCVEVPIGPTVLVIHPDFIRILPSGRVELIEAKSRLDGNDAKTRAEALEQTHSAVWGLKQDGVRVYEEIRNDDGELVDINPMPVPEVEGVAILVVGMHETPEHVGAPDEGEVERVGDFLTQKLIGAHEAITARLELKAFGEALGDEATDEERKRLEQLQAKVDKAWDVCVAWDMKYPGQSRTEPVEPVPDLEKGVEEFAVINAQKIHLEKVLKEKKKALELTMYEVEKEQYPHPWGTCRLMTKKNVHTDWDAVAADSGCTPEEAKQRYERVTHSTPFFRHWPNKKCKTAIADAQLEGSA